MDCRIKSGNDSILSRRDEIKSGLCLGADDMEQVTRRRFDVSEYYRMAETGILKPEERVELIDGDILVMSPAGSSHASMVDRLFRLLTKMLDGNALVRSQNPVHLDDNSEPEPDISVAWPRDDEYSLSHPIPSELLLVIEVADSSETRDRQTKRPVYARSGIPEFWLVIPARSANDPPTVTPSWSAKADHPCLWCGRTEARRGSSAFAEDDVRESKVRSVGISLSGPVIEIYGNPINGEYTDQSTARKGDVISMSLMPDFRIDTVKIFI